VQPQANLVRVKIPGYSSLAAFLAHYRALKSDTARSADDDQLLVEISKAMAALAPEAHAALDSPDDTSSARRHRARAELQLRREATARGIVTG